MQSSVRNSVDKILREQGEYIPLEYLIMEGRLLSEDFETWCSSDLSYLDEMLFGDPQQVLEQLIEAEEYVRALGLQAHTLNYQHWKNESRLPLMFSKNEALNRCFHTKYAKPEEQLQMDMFIDNPVGNLISDITMTLKNADKIKSRYYLERMYDMAPDHVRLGDLEFLVNALEQLDLPIVDIESELRHLQNHILPAAQIIFGQEARIVLIPYWRRLSNALLTIPFDKANDQVHISYTAGQAFDWEDVCNEIEKEERWWQYSVLVQRHAAACSRLNLREKAILSWFYLCWLHPDEAGILNNVSDPEIRNQWKTFLSLEPELANESFPVWLLLVLPGLVNVLPNIDHLIGYEEFVEQSNLFQLIYDRQKRKINNSGTLNDDEIQWRAELKQRDENLFKHYITTV